MPMPAAAPVLASIASSWKASVSPEVGGWFGGGVGAQHQHPHDVAARVVPLGLLDLRQAQRGRLDAGARDDDRQHQHDRQQPESQPDDLPRAPHDDASAGRASLSSRSTS